MGPNLLWHIGRGEAGIRHFMETLMDPMFALMKELGNPQMTTELKQTIIKGVMKEAGNRSVEKLAQEEHEMLLGLLSVRTKSAAASVSAKKGS
jgi:3-hydroxybutyryl-CoA dehydrogenase